MGRIWTSQPQYPVPIDPKWISRGLKAFYVLNAGLWKINLVTGKSSASAVGTGHTFGPNKIRTSGAAGEYINLGLDGFSAVAPFTIIVGHRNIGAGVSWGLLRRDTAVWYGIIQDDTFKTTTANNSTFDGTITPTSGGNTDGIVEYKATALAGANNLRGSIGGGTVSVDTSVTNPTGGGLTNVSIGASVRSIVDNPAVADFTYFGIFDGALSDEELKSLSANPWQIFLPEPSNEYSGISTASITADASITQSSDTSSSTAGLVLAADASITTSGDTAASTSLLSILADSSQTQANNTSTADGSVVIAADTSATQADNTLTSTATLVSDTITANADITQAGDTSDSTSALLLVASASATQAGDTSTADGALAVMADASITQSSDSVTADASIANITADASITQASDSTTATGALSIVAGAALTNDDNTLTSAVTTGSVVVLKSWSKNSFSLNGSALNGVALLPIVYGVVHGDAGAVGSVVAVKTQYAQASASAGATATIEYLANIPGAASFSAGAVGFITPIQSHLARSAFNAGATGVAYVYNTRFASFGGDGTAVGYAIPNSQLGDVAASGGASGSVTPTLNQHVRSSVSASASGTASGIRTHYPLTNISATCTATAEWQYKASGGSVWLHDGHTSVSAGGVLSVDETKYKVVVGNGFIATAESSAVVDGFVEHHAIKDSPCTAIGTASAIRTAYGAFSGSATCVSNIVGIGNRMARLAGACGATYSQALNSVTNTQSARSSVTGSAAGLANGKRYGFASSLNECSVLGWADGYALRLARVNASAAVTVTANAFANVGVWAPADRTVTVPAEYRDMFVPFDDRTMRLTA